MNEKPLLLTIPETCRETRLGRSKIYELIGEGEIETVKIGKSRRVPYASILALIEKTRVAA